MTGTSRIGLDDLAALEDQKRFLLRSLADLEEELAAGDISDDDYATLHADYTQRAAEVIRAIDDQRDLHEQARPDSHRARKAIAGVAVAIVAIVFGIVVAMTSGEDTTQATGGIDLTPSKEVSVCIDKMQNAFRPAAQGEENAQLATDALATIKCFTDHIESHPKDATAYTYRGWSLALLARQLDGVISTKDVQAFVQRASSDLAKARELAPRYPDALTYSAILAVWTQDIASAERFLKSIDDLRLPADAPILANVDQMLRPLLAAAKKNETSTTSTTSTTSVTSTTTSAPKRDGMGSAP